MKIRQKCIFRGTRRFSHGNADAWSYHFPFTTKKRVLSGSIRKNIRVGKKYGLITLIMEEKRYLKFFRNKDFQVGVGKRGREGLEDLKHGEYVVIGEDMTQVEQFDD